MFYLREPKPVLRVASAQQQLSIRQLSIRQRSIRQLSIRQFVMQVLLRFA